MDKHSQQHEPFGLIEDTREPDVQLAAMVPASVKRAVRRRAVEEGTTVRAIVLQALKAIGVAVPDDQVGDRRAGRLP